MYDSVSPSDGSAGNGHPASGLGPVRAVSTVRILLSPEGGRTHAARIFEEGSFRVRFPRSAGCEAVLLNTGGGMTGGDRLSLAIDVHSQAAATLTSQAAEKIYKSDGPATSIATTLKLAPGASLAWLPQETILFDHARLHRSFTADVDATATLTTLEIMVAGRIAHEERLTDASWRDVWRIRRSGKLIFADNAAIQGAIADRLDRPATGNGARALATLIHVAPDAEQRLDDVRRALADAKSLCAATAYDGMLVTRFAGVIPQDVRQDCIAAVTAIRAAPMPRAWSC